MFTENINKVEHYEMYVTKYIYSSTVCSFIEEIQTNSLTADMCEEWRQETR